MPTDGSYDGDLQDAALQEEIELVGDLVVAASSATGRLSQEEIDRLLGLPAGAQDAGPEPPP